MGFEGFASTVGQSFFWIGLNYFEDVEAKGVQGVGLWH